MKKIKKTGKLNIAILVVAMVLGMTVSSYAANSTTDPLVGATSEVMLTAEKANFSVTVPTQIPVVVKADGTVTGASGVITNGSAAPIIVSSINVKASTGWSLVAGDADLKASLINSKKLGLTINTLAGKSDGSFSVSKVSFPQINVGATQKLEWSGIATSFETAQAAATAATVTFTVGFAK